MSQGAGSNADKVAGDYHELLFAVRRSVRYHMRRCRWYESWHSVTNALCVIFGSATIFSILSTLNTLYPILAAAVFTIASTIDLVIGTTRMSRLHNDLAKRFIHLERETILAGEPTAESVRRFTATRLEIELDEPPVLRALDRICHNEQLRAMGYSSDQFVKIPLHHRLLAQVISFESSNS